MVIYAVDASLYGQWSNFGGLDLIGYQFGPSNVVVGEESVFHFVVAAVQQ